MKGIRKIAKEKQAAKNAKRNSEYVPMSVSSASQGAAACGGDAAAPQAMEDEEITSRQPHPGDNY